MARFRALQRGQVFADDLTAVRRADQSDSRRPVRIIEPGEIFDYHGEPGSWMEPVGKGEASDESGKKASGSAPVKKTSTTQDGKSDAGNDKP